VAMASGKSKKKLADLREMVVKSFNHSVFIHGLVRFSTPMNWITIILGLAHIVFAILAGVESIQKYYLNPTQLFLAYGFCIGSLTIIQLFFGIFYIIHHKTTEKKEGQVAPSKTHMLLVLLPNFIGIPTLIIVWRFMTLWMNANGGLRHAQSDPSKIDFGSTPESAVHAMEMVMRWNQLMSYIFFTSFGCASFATRAILAHAMPEAVLTRAKGA
jgi:vacuolar-type H+-ATPase subunit I/STV1